MNEGRGTVNERGGGVLLHLTSLPSRFGVGDLGPEARRFVDFLAEAGQRYWQILPLNPTDQAYDNSPYHSLSAFAFSTLLISPEILAEQGYCRPEDLEEPPSENPAKANFAWATEFKGRLFRTAYETFLRRPRDPAFERFCRENAVWLDDFAAFAAFKGHFKGRVWTSWPAEIRDRRPAGLKALGETLAREIEREKFLQFLFSEQWSSLRRYAADRGIRIIGDMPIYVDYDSADVWTSPGLFELDDRKRPAALAGVPPDYFSETGQLWGNPLYRWDALAASGFEWWVRRMGHNLGLLDMVRVDHFRGLVGYWRVPAGETTAINGEWVKAPAAELFERMRAEFRPLSIIAEDLGTITPDVKEVMRHFGFPGMKVLLFAFGEDNPFHPYLPHSFERNCVVYTGTHDNTTARGWFEDEAGPEDIARLVRYLGRDVDAGSVSWELIRLAYMSVADFAIVPVQDLLSLPGKARMNRPSTARGNWRWRLEPGRLGAPTAERLARFARTYGRVPGRPENG